MHIKPLEKTQQDGTPPRGSDSVSIRVNSSSHIFALGMLLHSACVRVTSGGFSLGEYLRGNISGGYLRGDISGGISPGEHLRGEYLQGEYLRREYLRGEYILELVLVLKPEQLIRFYDVCSYINKQDDSSWPSDWLS